MQMDHTIANLPSSEIATEPTAASPQQDLSAHEVQVILQYRAASHETRESVRRMLAPLITD